MFLRFLETLLLAAVGGFVFSLLPIPLPWLLGPMTAVLLGGLITRRTMYWPDKLFYLGLLLVGYSIGRSFTTETGQRIVSQFPAMMMATVGLIAFCVLQAVSFHKKRGVSLASSLIGSIPGGLSQMVLICTEIAEADLTVVTFLQTARVLGVLFTVPFLVMHGFGMDPATAQPFQEGVSVSFGHAALLVGMVLGAGMAAKRLRIPTPSLLGPILVTAAAVLLGLTAPPPPKPWLDMAQLSMGAFTGSRIRVSDIQDIKRFTLHTLANVVGLLIFSLAAGFILAHFFDLPVLTGFLCTAPGGIAEMALTSMMVHADTTMVVAFHLFRLLFILIVVPPLLRLTLIRSG